MNRVVSKLQRERILTAIKFSNGMEQDNCSIDASLQKQMASTDIQLQRTLETSRLIKVCGSSNRIKKLVQDGINQFHFVSSKLQIQRKQVATACASLARRSAKEVTLKHPMQSWCARYHLISAGKIGYDALIERLISWVALAIYAIPSIVDSDGSEQHEITQASCVLVMAFKEQLTRERTFLVSKGRSIMLQGGNAEKIFAILGATRIQILSTMKTLVAASPNKSYMMGPETTGVDLPIESKFVRGQAPEVETYPPIVNLLHKHEALKKVLQNEEERLKVEAMQFTSSPSKIYQFTSSPSKNYSEEPSVYMEWFQATQGFFDLIELSLSGIMRHFALSVPSDMACFPVDLERTVPMSAKASPQPALSDLSPVSSKVVSSWTPVFPEKLCDLSEGLVGEIVKGLREQRYSRIVALVGAGISVAAGVPDFRSPGGLYDQMRAQGFQHPMQVFTADFLRENPKSFYNMFSQLRTDHLTPTMVHYFLKLLNDQGCLLRCYTQNIDALERKVGLPTERLVEAHGTMAEARCLKCGVASTPEVLWAEWNSGNGQLPRCASPGCTGLLRPAVVFFGEQLDPGFRANSSADLNNADLVFIMGTSLSVEPFASLVQRAPCDVPRLLINRHVPYAMQRRPWELLTPSVFAKTHSKRKDASLLGECDDIIVQLMHELGWDARAQA